MCRKFYSPSVRVGCSINPTQKHYLLQHSDMRYIAILIALKHYSVTTVEFNQVNKNWTEHKHTHLENLIVGN